MKQPLGRDRLGRLMYPGDYVWPHKPDDPYWIPVWREEDGRVAFDEGFGLAEHTTWPEFVTIDLDASPKRTNFERYFADLGTIEEIGEAINSDCNCYIEEASAFWCDFAEHFHPDGVGYWLKQEATV